MIAGFQNCGAGFEVLRLGSNKSASTPEVVGKVPKLSPEDGPHTQVGDMLIQDNTIRQSEVYSDLTCVSRYRALFLISS